MNKRHPQPIKTSQIDGDVSVGRNVSMGGDATIQGRTLMKGNTIVEGWLIAANVVSSHKGYFRRKKDLNSSYPNPEDGWWAFVGTTLYVVVDGEWKIATGAFVEGGTSVDLFKKLFLSRLNPDTAHGEISFEKEIKSTIYADGEEGKGWRITEKGDGELDSLYIRKHVGSPVFISGFPGGYGWDIAPYTQTNAAGAEETKYRLEIDDVIIRGKLRVFEMIVSQLRGENDNVIFAGMMKVDHYDPATGRIYLDTDEGVIYNPFRPGDILMVQRFGGMPGPENDYNVIKQYELQVTEAQCGNLEDKEKRLDWIKFKNFVGSVSDIAEKDVLTRVDSATDSTRKGIVKIFTIDEIGAPYIDVMYGMKTNQHDALKARMGNLSGIRTKHGRNLDGLWGLYASGAYIENSSIILENGNTIEQEFYAMNGEFKSLISETRNEMIQESGNILVNSTFSKSTDEWILLNSEVNFYTCSNSFIMANGYFLSEKNRVADIYQDNDRKVLRLRNSGIKQMNSTIKIPPHEISDPDGYPYSFAFYYKVLEEGEITVGVAGSKLQVKEILPVSGKYDKLSHFAKWNETGDFEIIFTGEIYIYGVSLVNDTLTEMEERLKTEIKQNAESISLKASKEYVDSATNAIKEKYDAELKVTADQISQRVTHDEFSKGTDTLERRLEGKFDVQADKIQGVVTDINNISHTIQTSGWITRSDGVDIFSEEFNKTGVASSIANLNIKYNSISSSVSDNEQDISSVRGIAKAAATQAATALACGMYGQEQYSQTSNPWNGWSNGTQYKHVGALWYNPKTGVTQRYVGTDGGNKWETISDNAVSAASYVLQNKDKWSMVVANFDSKGKPTEASGIVTTAYGNSFWVKKSDYTGNNIASLINQSATTILLKASKIELEGAISANGTFQIDTNGTMTATGGKIGRFSIINNRLVWDQANYFGGPSRSLKLGYSTGREGVVDVLFDAATEGQFGIKAVGRSPGSAAIYGSSKTTQSYPTGDTVWAGWLDGFIYSDGYFTKTPKGKIRGGLKGAYRIDNSDTWFVFDNGIAVACSKPRAIDLDTDKF